MSRRKQQRIPWVLEISAPTGGDPVSVAAREKFLKQEVDRKIEDRLANITRALWEDPDYWKQEGLPQPTEPFPGLAAIRKHPAYLPVTRH